MKRLASIVGALLLGACGQTPGAANLLEKCTFGQSQDAIEPGDPFVYAFFGDGEWSVRTGIAAAQDPLVDPAPNLGVEPRVRAEIDGNRWLRWAGGSLGSVDEIPHGEVFLSFGTLDGADNAYPACVIWSQ